MIYKLINNIYIRNIALLLLFISIRFFEFYFSRKENLLLHFAIDSAVISILYLTTLIHNLFFYEKILRKKKYILYALSVLFLVILCQEISSLIYCLRPENTPTSPKNILGGWLTYLANRIVYLYAGFCIYLAFKYFKEKEEQLSLLNIKKDLELAQLKEQLKPHFLFNALNNIYSYNLQNNNDEKSNELILKLSELMRFVISEAENDYILLKEEVSFIENYMYFEDLRLGHRCKIIYKKDILNDNVLIAPFTLFTFVENAFKHGTNSINATAIEIIINCDHANSLTLSIVNDLTESMPSFNTRKGLLNVKQRLGILYPDCHKLNIINDGNKFSVLLNIDLS